MIRVPVLSPCGSPLMPTKCSRARRWLRSGKAKVVYNYLGIFTIQLISEPSGTKTQAISVGLDPGKKYTGIGVQSAKTTLWMAHLQLPFETLKAEMAGCVVYGWVSGDTERQVSVSDINWKRLGQFSAKKTCLVKRSTGLLVSPNKELSNLPPLRGRI